MRRAQRKLRQRRVFLVIGELRLELHLLFGQFALFLQAAYQLLLRDIALVFAMVRQLLEPGNLLFRRLDPRPRKHRDHDAENEAEGNAAPDSAARCGSRAIGCARGCHWPTREEWKQKMHMQDAWRICARRPHLTIEEG